MTPAPRTPSDARPAKARADDVAVIATGAMFPGRGDTDGFWRDVVEGIDTFTDVPATHWLAQDHHHPDPAVPDRTYGRRGGFLRPVAFDPLAFGIPPTALASTDTCQLLALVVADRMLAEVERGRPGGIDKARTSVILGVASTTELAGHMAARVQRPAWEAGLRAAGLVEGEVERIADLITGQFTPWKETTFPGLLGNVVAGRIANRFDLGGSNYVTDAACASSLSALQGALHELRSGDSDMVLTGGVDALNDIFMYMCFSKTPALSPTGDCRALSADADGTMLGEGLGMLALRRLDDAERDGDRIHAVIRGVGGGSDGRATAIYAPLPSGQARTLGRAYARAGYGPETVELMEAHGTGTVAGDRAELEGLHAVFGRDPRRVRSCALGSIKSQIGHTKAAAGSASLLKVIGALSRKILPPTIKVRQPAAALGEDSPFYLSPVARPWVRGSDHPRRASVSSFGFGGSNFHATLEEYRGANAVRPVRLLPAELSLFCADTAAGLIERLRRAGDALVHQDDLAGMADGARDSFDREREHRVAIVAGTIEQFRHRADALIRRLSLPDTAAGTPQQPPDRWTHYRRGGAQAGKIALLCAGQGSHYLGMGAQLAMDFAAARAVWDRACDHPALEGMPLHGLAFPPPAFGAEGTERDLARLTDTRHAQPAIAAVTLAQLALLRQVGLEADLCGGHSFGEVMALHCAGVFDEATALTLAVERGRAVQQAVERTAHAARGGTGEGGTSAGGTGAGGMLAVLAGADAVRQLLSELPAGLLLANDNSPQQVVLSGEARLIERAGRLCDERGLVTTRLPVDTAFHTPRLNGASARFAQALQALPWAPGRIPVHANGTGEPYPDDPEAARELLATQISTPVRFREMIEGMHAAGARTFIEIGPGSALSGLVRATLDPDGLTVLSLDRRSDNGTASLLAAVGQLAVSGVDIDAGALFRDMPAPRPSTPRPAYAVDITGANHGKPYPPRPSAKIDSVPKVENPPMADRPPPAESPRSAPSLPPARDDAPMSATEPETPAMTSTRSSRDYRAAPQVVIAGTERLQLLREVSARQADYLNAVSGAQRQFLQFAAQLLGDDAASVSVDPMEVVAERLTDGLRERGQETVAGPRHEPEPAASSPPPAKVTEPVGPHRGTTNGSGAPAAFLAAPPAAPPAAPAANVPAAAPPDAGSPEPDRSPAAAQATAPDSDRSHATTNAGEADAGEADVGEADTDGSNVDGAADTGTSLSADLVRDLVAEKTGYPSEMIEDDMDLGGELGIDSIKQVEILSALNDRVPELPQLAPRDLVRLRSIGKIVSFFNGGTIGD